MNAEEIVIDRVLLVLKTNHMCHESSSGEETASFPMR
jgi:hypothetical protein